MLSNIRKRIILGLSTATVIAGTAGSAIAFGVLSRENAPTIQTIEDENILVSKPNQKTVPYYADLTEWMYSNKINPNILPFHESLEYFDEQYEVFKKQHPISHTLEKYESSVKDSLNKYIGTIPTDGSDANKKMTYSSVDNVTPIDHLYTKNLPAYKNISELENSNKGFTPSQIIWFIDLYCGMLEKDLPEYKSEIQFINSVIDMIITQDYTGNKAVEKIVDGVFSCLEKYIPTLADPLYILNSSIDMVIMSGLSQQETIKQTNGLIDVVASQYPQYQNIFDISKYCLDILILYYLSPSPTPSPTPTPSPVVSVLEEFASEIIGKLIGVLPEYKAELEQSQKVLFNVLECDWNDEYNVAHTFDSVFDLLNTILPSQHVIWFVLNNSLDLIVLNNFDRLTVWSQLDGLLNLAKSQLPQEYIQSIDYIKGFVDSICSDPIKYATFSTVVKTYLSGEWKNIRGSLYTAKMLAFAVKCLYASMTPSIDMWWYGQGGDDKWAGNGYYGYFLSNKVSYKGTFPWSKLQSGDLVYEEGGVNYIGGHSGLIDGIYYDIGHNELYVKGVEPYSPAGVEASVWDSSRIKARNTHLAHATKATQEQKDSAIDYAYSQIGHPYAISVAEKPTDEQLKNNGASWYCSELTNYSYAQSGYEIVNYSYANNFRGGNMVTIIKSLWYDLQYFDGSRSFTEIPGDMNFLDILAIGCGMVTPREINSSNLIQDYLH